VNFLTDTLLQPVLATLIELTLWIAVFHSTDKSTIGGFTRDYYLSYVLWAAFITRITTNWMYEYRMIEEIDTGSVNSILTRPVTYFEYYMSQFFGYKALTTAVSLSVPLIFELVFDSPVELRRLPLALLLVFYYVFHAYVLSFFITSLAFLFKRVYSLTVAKNLLLWLLAGELFPLDLLPQPYKDILIALPFSSGVYIPVGYLTGRFGTELILQGFLSVTVGILFFGTLAFISWRTGLKQYTGTGA
jgi:ABC-2 type transport system permease protein